LPFLRVPKTTRVVVFLHGIEAWQPASRVTRWLLRRVDLFLSNSEYTWQCFAVAHPELAEQPYCVVHLGLGEPSPGEPPPPTDTAVALMLSRLAASEDYKGHREVLSAWPRVRAQMPSAELWVAGDGDLRADLERLAVGLGIDHAVRFFGAIDENEKQRLLASSRCFLLPSRGEGFGLVYLEAMRLGRPCLVSTSDAGREVVNPPEAGLAATVDDPEALADAICELLASRDGWSRAAQQRYARQFTARQFQERLRAALGIGLTDGPAWSGLTAMPRPTPGSWHGITPNEQCGDASAARHSLDRRALRWPEPGDR
jgi:phosphatidylinositol alpha-1,6-mannosyltransferase